MRILYHCRTLADGAEGIHIRSIVAAFRSLGHDVEISSVAESPSGASRAATADRIRRLLPRAGFELASTGLNAAEYLTVRRQIAQFKPDLLYARHARLGIGAIAAATHAAVPTILEVNALFTQGEYHVCEPISLKRLATAVERRVLRLATLVYAVSTPLAAQVLDLSGRQALVVPNGADPVKFDLRRTHPEKVRERYALGGRVTVGWSGIIRDWHGLDRLLESVAVIPQGHLLVVGDGPARAALEQQAKALGVTDRLSITGRVPHEEVPDHIAAMDVAVVSDDRTGVASPMKLLEYMAMSRAAVAPRLPNIQDVIHDGEDGVLFAPEDPNGLREALRRLAADAALRQRLGAAARQRVERDRNWIAIAQLVLDAVRTASQRTRRADRTMPYASSI